MYYTCTAESKIETKTKTAPRFSCYFAITKLHSFNLFETPIEYKSNKSINPVNAEFLNQTADIMWDSFRIQLILSVHNT